MIYKHKAFSMVETIVAIAIFILGTFATTMVFSKIMQNKAYTLEMGKSAFVVSRSIGDVTQYLRRARQSDAGSYPLVSAANNDLVFYSDYDKDGTTEKVHVYFSASKVYLGISKPNNTFPVTYPAGDTTVKVIADHIVNTASDYMFTYYDKNYPADAALAVPIDVSQVRLVRIFLKINIDPNKAPDNIQQETFVEIRNLNDYDTIH